MSHREDKDDRVRRIKEERRRAHEERLEQLNRKAPDEDEFLSRFTKYRRSGRGQDLATSDHTENSNGDMLSHPTEIREKSFKHPRIKIRSRFNETVDICEPPETNRSAGKTEFFNGSIFRDSIIPTEKAISSSIVDKNTSPQGDLSPENLITEDLTCSASFHSNKAAPQVGNSSSSTSIDCGSEGDQHGISNCGGVSDKDPVAKIASSFLSGSQDRVLRKPNIPTILKSSGETFVTEDAPTKKPSILKKKDDAHSGSPLATVSFGLSASTSVLTRTKSTDSNLSAETETGYWSGGESISGILKSACSRSNSDRDQRSILKHRRSSLGSSAVTCSEGGLHSILKRKLSHDSSLIMKEWYSSENSLSTGSLTQCGSPSPEPKPILKKTSSEDFEELEPKPILKNRNSREFYESSGFLEGEKIKPCLKKFISKSTDEGVAMSSTSPPSFFRSANGRGILKKTGILKKKGNDSSASESDCFRSVDFDSRTMDSSVAGKEAEGETNCRRWLGASLSNRLTSHAVETGCVNVLRQKGNAELNTSEGTKKTSLNSDGDTNGDFRRHLSSPLNNLKKCEIGSDLPEDLSSILYNLHPVKDRLLPGDCLNSTGGVQGKMEDLSVKRSDSQEDIIMNLSVAEKRSLFMQMERERQLNSTNKKNVGSGANRTKRFTTQPVTTDEVEKASKLVVNREIDDSDECVTESGSGKANREILNAIFKPKNEGEQNRILSPSSQVSHHNRKLDIEKNGNANGGLTKGYKFSGLSFDSAFTRDKSSTTPSPDESATTNNRADVVDNSRHSDATKMGLDRSDPSRMSLRDRVRMFNSMSSSETSSKNFVLPTKKSVTSKRFNTQPVCPNDRLRILTYELSHSPTREASAAVLAGGVEHTTDKSKSTVRDEEGQECESECGQGCTTASGDAHLNAQPLSSSNSTSDVESNTSSPTSASSKRIKMPEKVSFPEDYDNIRESVDIIGSSDRKNAMKKSNRISSCEMTTEQDLTAYQVKPKGNRSIAEKIAALQTNGESGWKKRISKCEPEKETCAAEDQNDNDSSVVASRLSLLETAQESWKKRVLESDATNFTVQGKLEKAGKFNKESSPLGDRKIRAIKGLSPLRLKSKERKSLYRPDESSTQEKILNEENKLQRRLSMPLNLITRSDTSSSSDSNAEEEKVIRNVVKNDNETFTQFFSSVSKSVGSNSVQVDESSFIAIQTEQRQLLGMKRNIKAHRNHGNVKNPIKALASRINLAEQSYAEINPEIRIREMKKRTQIDNLAKNSHLSIEALAGLASKEDFTAVKLKKAQLENNKEYPHPMLIRVKGRRLVQSRLVPPLVKSLNSGDNYILVLPDKIYHYVGEFSNRMERSKSADLVAHIAQKKDLGCRVSSLKQIVSLEEPRIGGTEWEKFFKLLGGDQTKISDDGLGDELDEAYEIGVNGTNRIYEADGDKLELVPVVQDDYWVTVPKYSILKDDKVLVFDFGSELYVWAGSKTESPLKKLGYQLAKELFQNAYDYSEIDAECSPIEPSKGSLRPDWCWLKRINQKMEPITFIEKFFDWPDDSGRMIKVNQVRSRDSLCKEAGFNFHPYDINEMLNAVEIVEDPSLDLEGFDVRRGTQIYDTEERRTFTITTVDVQTWHVSEFSTTEVEAKSSGHFFSDETYVIRWQYSISQIGRDLKGNTSRHAATLGRDRFAYFFWHGGDSKVTEQGTSALMTVELDKEKGPQIRVEQGHEPPAFLSLFKGRMFLHLGQSSKNDCVNEECRLYVVMGCIEEEGHLVEVPCSASSFRSRGSFILIDRLKSRVFCWNGCLSNEVTKTIAQNAIKYIQNNPSHWAVSGITKYMDVEEGFESSQFLNCVGATSEMNFRESYVSLTGQTRKDIYNINMFAFRSLTGSFDAYPIFSSKRKREHEEVFPVLQGDLFTAQQPCLFLMSNGEDTFLWQGWRPRDEENENTSTGSGEFRWAAERKAALETTLEYCKHTKTNGYLVHAGVEPIRFRNLFPYWMVHPDVREISMSDGRSEQDSVSLEQELKKFLKTTYTVEELQERPEGVDLSKLETYLSDDDFETLLKMSREDFSKLQAWKKTEMKKQAGLF